MKAVQVQEQSAPTELDRMWADYVRLITQISEEHRPIWVAYYSNIYRDQVQLIAVTPTDDKEAQFNLFRAEAKMSAEKDQNPSAYPYYLDTLVFEEEDASDARPDGVTLIQIYPPIQ
jgi:hypothetical protein